MSDVFIILGMHRSGTSLLARYLAACGVSMGGSLLPGHPTNPAGHFEDKEFLSLHNDILQAHGTDYKVMHDIDWQYDQAIRTRASSLVQTRSHLARWGWKDPRTCLFLDLWKPLVPDAHYLIPVRPYEPVIRSLLTRDLAFYAERTSLLTRWRNPLYRQSELSEKANAYLKVWLHYARCILRHLQNDVDRCYVLDFRDMTQGRFQLPFIELGITEPITFASDKSRSRERRKVVFSLDKGLAEQADQLFTELQAFIKPQ